MGQSAPGRWRSRAIRIKASLRDGFPLLFGERWREAIGIYRTAFEHAHLTSLREMPAAGAMLTGLRDCRTLSRGRSATRRDAICASRPRILAGRAISDASSERRIAETDKPTVAPVEMALAGSGLRRGADVWFVGDADIDMACAVNAGCTPVLLRERAPEADEFVSARPLGHVQNCAGLADLVAQLSSFPRPGIVIPMNRGPVAVLIGSGARIDDGSESGPQQTGPR